MTTPSAAAAAAMLLLLAALPLIAGPYALGVGFQLLMWIALTQSWVLLSGLTGYVSLGHAVFYGLGGYVTVLSWQALPLPVAVALSGAVAALFALAVGYPVLRVRGPYFVILTFGLAEFVKYIVIDIEAALGKFGRLMMGAPRTRRAVLARCWALAAACDAMRPARRRSPFRRGPARHPRERGRGRDGGRAGRALQADGLRGSRPSFPAWSAG